MDNFLIALAIGVAAGVLDVVPMIIQKLDKTSCYSAFVHYVVLGIIIPYVQWDIAPWLKGSIVAVLLSVPVMIIVFSKDWKALIPMSVFSVVLGAGIGFAGAKLLG